MSLLPPEGPVLAVADGKGLVVADNPPSGLEVRVESPGAVRLAGNVSRDVTADPVDPVRGDLHLRRAVAGAIGRARPLAEVPEHIGGQPRGPGTDVGADRLVRGDRAARHRPRPSALVPAPARPMVGPWHAAVSSGKMVGGPRPRRPPGQTIRQR
jgi:hypothetical protein